MSQHPLDRLDDDMRDHLERETQENIARGLSREDARHAALRTFGSMAYAMENTRAVWIPVWIEQAAQDVRYGLRTLRRSPTFALIAIVTLALGIGSTTVAFSVIDSFLLNPAPFLHSERLAEIWTWSARGGGPAQPAPMLQPWRSQTDLFEQVEGHWESSFIVTGGDEPELIWGSQVTVGLFPFLGVRPALGRDFMAAESDSRVVVISHRLWQQRFGGRADVLDQTLQLDGDVYTVIGVMPSAFRFPVTRIDLWTPFDPRAPNPLSPRRVFTPIVRLRADVPFEQADQRVSLLSRQLDDTLATRPGTTARLQTLYRYSPTSLAGQSWFVTNRRTALFLIFGAAALVLLASCTNAANLFMARALSRAPEIGLRSAIGGGPWRLMRQFLTETAVIVAISGTLGVLVAGWALQGLVAITPVEFADASLNPLDLDGRAAAWALIASALAALLAGVLPTVRAVRGDLAVPLMRRSEQGRAGRFELRRLLVAVQSAIAITILIGAGLFARNLWLLQAAETGWNRADILVVRPQFRGARYTSVDGRVDFFERLLESVRDHPGIQSAAVSEGVPLRPLGVWYGTLEGDVSSIPNAETTNVRVSEAFFTTMGIRIESGRSFTKAEHSSQEMAIVSRSMAQQLWPSETAVGKRFRFEGTPAFLTVVGVAGDVQTRSAVTVNADPMEIYRPLGAPAGPASAMNPYINAVIRTDGRDGLIPALKQAAKGLDANLVLNVQPMQTILRETLAEPAFTATLLVGCALLGLMLGAAGVYAVVTYEARSRTHEIGIRVSLGATRLDILRHLMFRSMWLTSIGMGAGIASSFALSRSLSSLLFGIRPSDPMTFVGAAVLLSMIVLLAAYLPARRATNVDPLIALRAE